MQKKSTTEPIPSKKCPSCGFTNLPGEDRCKECLHSLTARDLPKPQRGEKIQKIMMTDAIANLVTGEDLLVASPTDTIQKIIRVFQDQQKDCIVVYKRKKIIGILSYRDILHKVAGKYKDLSKVSIESIMTPNPEFVHPEDPIAFVVNKMSVGGFRHVPVLDKDGSPISIITIRDVLAYLAQHDTF